MITVLIKAAQLVLSLSILVIIHELGHFTFAKIFKTRVEKFYLFFNPWFSIWKHKVGETEYGIGWLPLGGYVKIAGMIDESMDKEQMEKPAEPWEFRSKPAGQRLLIMVGGVLFNFLLAMLIYAAIVFTWGDTYLANNSLKDGVTCNQVTKDVGFQNGDHIVSIDGKPIKKFGEISIDLLLDDVKEVKVLRNGMEHGILIGKDAHAAFVDVATKKKEHLFAPRVRNYPIGGVIDTMPAGKAGLKIGDVVVAVNSDVVHFADELPVLIKKYAADSIHLMVDRTGQRISVSVLVPQAGLIGILPADLDSSFFITDHYGFFASIPAGIHKGVDGVVSYVKQLKLLFMMKGAAKQMGGFLSIGKIFPAQWNWQQFWSLTAFLSVVLGVMNILPIPALDGGHVMFVLYEVVTRRKPNEKFMEYATIVGMILLLGLILLANGNDIFKLFQK